MSDKNIHQNYFDDFHFPFSYQMDSWLGLVCQRPGDHQHHICSQLAHGTCTSVHPSGWGPCVMYR